MNLFSFISSSYRKLRNEYLKSEIKKNSLIQEYYEAISKNLSGKSVSGGVSNSSINNADMTDNWSFPRNFVVTAKMMDNSSECSNILNSYTSMIKSFKWDIVYKDDKFNEEPSHKEALELIKTQFEQMGGLNNFIGNAIREYMKYGLVFINPIIDFKSVKIFNRFKLLPIISSFRLLDPQWILNFYHDVDNTEIVSAVRYQSQPKSLYDSSTGEIVDLQTMNEIIDFNKSLSCLLSLDGNGDPLGKSFLKDIWGEWRILNNLKTSFNQNLISVGEHSYQFIPNQLFFENSNPINEVVADIQNFVNGGGVFTCSYGTLQKIDGMDPSNYVDYQKNITTEIARRKGLNIEVLGQSSGSSRNLAQFAQADALTRGKDIADQFAFQFSEMFIKRYFENVFAEQFFTKKLKDTPHLIFELEEGTPDSIAKNLEKETLQKDNQELSTLTINSNGSFVQSNNKTWIKSKASDVESYVINTQELDDVLLDVEKQIENFTIEEMKKYLTDSNRISDAIKNPQSIVNKRTMSKDEEKAFNNKLSDVIYYSLLSYFILESNDYEKALKIQGRDFFDVVGKTKSDFAISLTQKAMNSNEIKEFKRLQLTAFINELDNTMAKEITNLRTLLQDDKEEAEKQLTSNLANIQGRDFKKLVPSSVMSLYAIATKQFIDDTDNEGMSLIRSGVLENQCEHCKEFMGAEYEYINGEWTGVLEYKDLPDSDCLGGDRCRCFYKKVPFSQIKAMQEYQNG